MTVVDADKPSGGRAATRFNRRFTDPDDYVLVVELRPYSLAA
jgi:hypothetical protein